MSFSYQSSNPGIHSWVLGTDDVASGTSTTLRSTPIGYANTTQRYTQTFIASCGSDWVGLSKSGTSTGSDLVLDDFMVRDLGATGEEPGCARVSGTDPDGDFAPGVAGTLTTTFTNAEESAVTNVGVSLAGVPEGWTVQVAAEDGNLFNSVAPGESVTTDWLLTPPAGTEAGSREITVQAAYDVDCKPRAVEGWTSITVASRASVPLSAITATTSSEELASGGPAEGPVGNAFDGDTDTIWHTSWDGVAFPHWVQMDLGSTYAVDGFGYLNRSAGGPNGRVKDYTVEVSTDGTVWTQVATGAFFADSPSIQDVNFASVNVRYVKLNALSSHSGELYSAAAEMRVYGSGGTAATGFAPGVRSVDPECQQAPGAPTDVTAQLAGTDVEVSWAAPESDGNSAVTEYRIYQEGTAEPVGTVAGDATPFTVTGLAAGSSHRFAVSAVNAVGEGERSDWSEEVTIPGIDFEATVLTRCVGGKVRLEVSVKNTDDVKVDVTVASEHGSDSLKNLKPGKSGSVSIKPKMTSIEAGTVTVTVSATGQPTTVKTLSYAPASCR